MYDCNTKMLKFYHDHVRLGGDLRTQLKDQRDINLDRLNNGLMKLGTRHGVIYPPFVFHQNQGSYAMHTLNKHPKKDYDIDVGVIFEKDDLSSNPHDARALVGAAMKEAGGNFSKEPETRTNAVTIWYAEGHHVDFAVYRQYSENGIMVFEHAGNEWKRRNPLEVSQWFQERVDTLSPSKALGALVEPQQLRRIVRLVKAFAKSQPLLKLPGGMIITTLVVECYKAHPYFDDIALFNTLKALQSRLQYDVRVMSPVELGAELTGKLKYQSQVRQFVNELDRVLTALNVLEQEDCNILIASKAWYAFFNHDFWLAPAFALPKGSPLPPTPQKLQDDYFYQPSPLWPLDIDLSVRVKITAELFDSRNNSKGYVESDKFVAFPKFEIRYIAEVAGVFAPFELQWQVVNTGDHASSENALRGEFFYGKKRGGNALHDNPLLNWESTKYHGRHFIECFVIKDGRLIGKSGRFFVQVANPNWRTYKKFRG